MFAASGWRDSGVQTIWLSVFGSVKFVGGPSRNARGFWDEFSRDAMPGHVSLAPSKRSQPVTADISSALQASHPRCSPGDLVKSMLILSSHPPRFPSCVTSSCFPNVLMVEGLARLFFVSPRERGASVSHGCLCITCGEHLAFKKKKVCMGMCVCLHAMFVYLFDARNLPWGFSK